MTHAITDAPKDLKHFAEMSCFWKDWRDADSRELLAHVQALLDARAWRVTNVDVTVIAETPKLAGHDEAMCTSIAGLLRVPVNAVNVKATTHEGLGALGAGEGLAAHAVALLEAD